MATIEHPRPEGLLHNAGFSQVVVASGRRIVHTAGQVAIDERGAPTRATRQAKRERVGPMQYLREVRDEMRKVAWPTWPEVRRYSLVVLVTVVIFTAMIGATDALFGIMSDWLYEN